MNKQKLEELISAYSGKKFADLLFQANFEENRKNLDVILPGDDVFAAAQQLGEIKTRDNQKVIVVETKVNNDLSERSSRKKQFDIGKKLLQNNQAYSAGLLVFYDERGAFRLSLVHPKFEGTKRSYNSFKRYTFYINPSHSNKTFINQFAGASFDTLDSIKEVFSVAKVTYDFFKEYKRLFEQIVEHIKVDKHFPSFAEQNGITINDVAKKLLGQIVFLYFLQRKGWLGAPKGQHVSKGDQNFLRTLFNKAKESEAAHPDTQMNFFNDYLEYLFYDALNKPISDSATSCYRQRFDCQIPFLNGGLFEPIPEYKWQERFLQIPDDIFSNKDETGVLDIFDSYNFTIDENSADDQEVSVDPEMLGKVFENLLEENLRKGTGSFYTPREIVQYMVTESLKQYLRDKADISEEKIATVLEEYHNECEVSEGEAEKIDSALKQVRVVDPACGSGAFLVGLLQEIAHIRYYCQRCYQTEPQTYYQIKKEIIRDSIYGVDLDGGAVDIARLRFWLSMVVDHDIEIDDIEPLPNLDYKLMQGNSLLEDMYVGDIKIKLNLDSDKRVDRRTKQGKLIDDGEVEMETMPIEGMIAETGELIADKLVRHHNDFFAEKDPTKKVQLKKKIDSLESDLIVAGHDDALKVLDSKLRNSQKDAEKKKIKERIGEVKSSRDSWLKFRIRPYFPWRLHFSEVFESGGFDIVIGNPPYGAKVTAQEKGYFKDEYWTAKTDKSSKGSVDTYSIFTDLALEHISTKNAVVSYIVPMAITSSGSVERLHKLFFANTESMYVSSYSDRPKKIFDSAETACSIFIAKKNSETQCKLFTTKVNKRYSNEVTVDEIINGLEFVDSTNYVTPGRLPKVGKKIELQILNTVFSQPNNIFDYSDDNGNGFYYRGTGGRYYKIITNFKTHSSEEREILTSEDTTDFLCAIFSTNLYFWFYHIYSDNLHIKQGDLELFRVPDFKKVSASTKKKIESKYAEYLKNLEENSEIQNQKRQGTIKQIKVFNARKAKHLIDDLDRLICPLYGLTDEQTEFVINYDLKFRTD